MATNKTKFRLKVATYGGERKHIEIPKSIRDNFKNKEEVIVEKSTNTHNTKKEK